MAPFDGRAAPVIAVADTSPLHYLVLVGAVEHLPLLFDTVHAPISVLAELTPSRAPEVVRHWATAPPAWLHIADAQSEPADACSRLGAGERAVLAWRASRNSDAVLLLDDRDAVRYAVRQQWSVLGTLGVLRALAATPTVRLDLRDALTRLRATNFRVTDAQVLAVLQAAAND